MDGRDGDLKREFEAEETTLGWRSTSKCSAKNRSEVNDNATCKGILSSRFLKCLCHTRHAQKPTKAEKGTIGPRY